ncbi:pyrimidodiazepine synthase isoform X1 [Drosophila subobscura]|uniref:pyrimidodiazepine synthase isoform X1 n=2 Tax=Drosophila subobscura TaxID=7241 RepID=UPI00155ABE1D|nr:pyrimidodiazepine synthase isoform X1 [Drosophila subobscura]XP_034658467.1 pyrimidodiazepine synthase isoform X1 [Drosophila subobscura]
MNETEHFTTDSTKPIHPDDGVLRLYSMRFCPYAHRVHLVLDAKNIPYHSIYINLQAKPDWFVKMSSTAKVPALELVKESGNPVLVESLVICDYLDEVYPEVPLYPTDPLKKAQDKILIQRFGLFIAAIYKLLLDDNPDLDLAELNAGLDIYENELKQRGDKFFGGARPGMLDYMIWPWCERFAALKHDDGTQVELDSQRFVTLLKWRDLMLQDKAVKSFYLDGETHAKYMSSRRAGNANYNMLYHAAKRARRE